MSANQPTRTFHMYATTMGVTYNGGSGEPMEIPRKKKKRFTDFCCMTHGCISRFFHPVRTNEDT